MSADASIAMSVKDNLSAAITGMKSSVTNFRSDVVALQGELDRLNATRVQMRMDLTGAKREAQQAQKAFEALGDAATDAERQAAEADWKKAEENLENIRQQYDLVGRQVRQTTRDMENATGAISRAENRAGGSRGMGMLSALGKAGLYDMLGEAAGQWANTLVSSGLGSDAGSLFSSALSGAGSGAAIGTMITPGIGTAVGAAAGAGIGLLTGASQVYGQQDEAFKSYVQEATQGQLDEMSESITSGSATAAQRELDAIAFNQLLGKGVGDTFLTELRTMAAETPMEYADLTSMSRALATGFKDAPDRILELMKAIGDAGSAVGVTASDMTAMAQAMSRMQSSGKSTLEYLNIFQDRGVDVIGMLSEAMGKTQGEIYDMISKGSISGTQAVDIIQQGLGQYAGAMDEMSRTFSGLESTLNDARTEMDNAYGKGYNAERNIGMQAEIDYLNGENSAALRETNEALGAWRASLENTKEQYRREAELAVTAGTEAASLTEDAQKRLSELREQYLLADGDAVEQGRIIAEAQILAQGEYMASDGAQQLVEYEKSLATAVREDAASNDAYWDAGYRKGQEYNKGILAARSSFQMPTGPGLDENGLLENWTDDGGNVHTSGGGDGWYDDGGNFHPYAFGIWRVPYDNFPALLHQGERVLTAREAGETDRNRTPIQITITGNQFGAGVTAEEIAQRLADALEIKLAAGRVRT